MRSSVQLACTVLAVLVITLRAVQLLVFLPFAGSIFSFDGEYLLFVIILEAGLLTLSHTSRFSLAARFGMLIPILALSYWWFHICRGEHPIWVDFRWWVVPEFLFAGMILGRSIAAERHLSV
jgi:hypothetical protein